MAGLPRGSRLKVYSTQIGLHSWVVAAPSQKAALAAWDVKENLFASGAARVVSDKAAVELAMRTPGKAMTLGATHDLAKAARAVGFDEHRRSEGPRDRPTKRAAAKPAVKRTLTVKRASVVKRASGVARSKLDRAEDALNAFQKRAASKRAAMTRQQRALDHKATDLIDDLAKEEAELTRVLEQARIDYERDP
jgi:colicin import membrane protein